MRRPRLPATAAALLAGLAAASAAPALASNGPIPTSVGTKGPVSIPVDGDAQTMFRMPSSIGFALDHRFDFDLFWVQTASEVRNSLNDFRSEGGTIGASGGVLFAPGRPDWDTDDDEVLDAYTPARKITLGIGVYPDMAGGGGDKSKYRLTTFPETIGLQTAIQFITGAVNVAFTPTPWLSLGVGLHAIYSTIDTTSLVGGSSTPLGGSPTINGVPFPGNPSYADFLNLFSSDQASDPSTLFKSDMSAIQFSAIFSLSLRPMENLGFGFSYRDRSWAPSPYESRATVDSSRTFLLALQGLDPAIQSLFLSTLPERGANGFVGRYKLELEGLHVPRQVRTNVVFWPVEWLLLSAEVGWIEWGRAFGEPRVRLREGSNTDVNFVVGSSSINTKLKQRWRNQWVFAFQGAVAVTEKVTIRAGVNYGKNPINVNYQGATATSAFSDLTASLGGGVRLTDRIELNALFEISPPTSARAGPRTDQLTARNSRYGAEQYFFHIGVGIAF